MGKKVRYELTQKALDYLANNKASNDCEYLMSDIRGALARGYCAKENSNKELDSDLLEAQAIEVKQFISGLCKKVGI